MKRAQRTRGAAMLEALIALPVLWILALGTQHVRDRYLGQQHAALLARRCAWQHAIGGCRSIPSDCEGVLERAGATTGSTPDGARLEQGIRDRQRGELDVLADIPLLGAAIRALFGTSTFAQVESRLRSPFDRSRTVTDRMGFVVLCNEHPVDAFEAARDVLCQHLPLLECAGD